MIIAVDGPAAAGKGTIARALADHFHYHFLDTGRLYRMVGLMLLRDNIDPHLAKEAGLYAANLIPDDFDEAQLRQAEVSAAASMVAVHQEVRHALLGIQRQFAQRSPGSVLDGRDIGTVICPQADVKIYVTASLEVRAQRRFKELQHSGETPLSYEQVLADIQQRDERDHARANAPLLPAEDAIILDTTFLSIDQAIAAAIDYCATQKARHG